jgi:hypothetical protein
MAKKAKSKGKNQAERGPEMEPIQREVLKEFVYFCVGDPRLTAWEANFINSMKLKIHMAKPMVTVNQANIIEEIKEKVNFRDANRTIPEVDLVVETADPDGYEMDADGFIIRPSEDDEFNRRGAEALDTEIQDQPLPR